MILGVFDSGLGGLTVLKEILKNNTYDKIVYYGDTLRVPYGDKDKETLFEYAKDDIKFLKDKNVDEIVVACGTISSNVLDDIKDDYNFNIYGIIDAACVGAKEKTKNNKIGVIATQATINTHIFKDKLKDYEVIEVGCPKFTPLIEADKIDCKEMDEAIDEYLSVFKKENIDTLILGCTHYPLLSDKINKYFNNSVYLINSGTVLSKELNSGDFKNPKLEFYVSGNKEFFKMKAKKFLDVKELENVSN